MRLLAISVLAWKQVRRHPTRSLLTVLGVATGMFLFAAIETVQGSLDRATRERSGAVRLVVYRENRFCPFTSQLPDHYRRRIAEIPGVAAAIPIKVMVNNCSTSLDVVTFRGLPVDQIERMLGPSLQVLEGDLASWRRRSDAVLLGEVLARRRGLAVGDSFEAAGVTVHVAGIIASDDPQTRNLGYTHLDFLQRSSPAGLGVVTQFTVPLESGAEADAVAAAIDAAFADDTEPTATRPEQAFLLQSAGDMLALIRFTRSVSIAAVLAVLALVANTVLLAVRGRIKEHAILQTLGFPGWMQGWMVLVEGILLGLFGGVVGIVAAAAVMHVGGFALSSEGLSIVFEPTVTVVIQGMGLALAIGLIAGLVPAWIAGRAPIVTALRGGG